MKVNVRIKALAVLVAVAVVVAGCDGRATRPTDITGTSATLHALVRCSADTTTNPCTFWFQYWADGATTVSRTAPTAANYNTNNGYADVSQPISGLTPNTLYHAQLCGYGDSNVSQPGICVGLAGGGLSSPGSQPDLSDFNSTQRFRTAGPGTVATAELGRPLSTADTAQNPISRDAGQSAAYSSTRSLWLFGDTVQRNGPAFLAGTTAAAGPFTRGEAPSALEELPTPPAAPTPGRTSPAPFLPVPQDLVTPDNPPVACGTNSSYAAAWPSGLARVPDTARVLVVYAQVCVAINRTWPTGRLTLVEYDPASNTRVLDDPVRRQSAGRRPAVDPAAVLAGLRRRRLPVPVRRRPGREEGVRRPGRGQRGRLGQRGQLPVVGPAGRAATPQWTTDRSSVASLISGVVPWRCRSPTTPGVGSHHLAMIVQTQFGTGEFQVFQAVAPTGAWTAGSAGRRSGPVRRDVRLLRAGRRMPS